MELQMATPVINVNVTFKYKSGTPIQYNDVKFFSHAAMLLFNGEHSKISINQQEIECLSIDDQSYLIKEVKQTDNGALTIWLELM
jgi:hypothetical protein